MATLESLNLQDGARIDETLDGLTVTGTAVVSGVTAAGTAGLIEALSADGVPAIGDECPSVSGAYLERRTPQGIGGGTVRIRLQYVWQGRQGGEPTIVSSTRCQSEEAWDAYALEDWDPAFNDKDFYIVVGQELNAAGEPDAAGETQTQAASVSVLRPHRVWEMDRVESEDPANWAGAYVGRVNSAGGFPPGGSDQDYGTWLCTDISGRSPDGGKTWQVHYAFEFKATGWDPVASFKVPKTGAPPPWGGEDTSDEAFRLCREYLPADFGGLHLTRADPLAGAVHWGNLG